MEQEAVDLCVIGGGISGLACAHQWRQAVAGGGAEDRVRRVLVLEATERWGGKIDTRRIETAAGAVQFEAGPNTLLLNSQPTLDLLDELGLTQDIVKPTAHASRRWVCKGQRLLPLPHGLFDALRSELVGISGALGFLRDLCTFTPDVHAPTQTVAEFVRGHFGDTILRNLAEPFMTGVYAGDVEQMEAACAGMLIPAVQAASKHGSVIRGLAMEARAARASGKPKLPMASGTLRSGLSQLPERLIERLCSTAADAGASAETNAGVSARVGCRTRVIGEARLSTAVESLEWDGRAESPVTVVTAGGGTIAARRVVLAADVANAARLLGSCPARAAAAIPLAALDLIPMSVAALLVPRRLIGHTLDGFGFLCARGPFKGQHQPRVLGTIFRSSIFPASAPADHVLLVSFIGGAHQRELAQLGTDQLRPLVREDLHRILDGSWAEADEVWFDVARWPQALPHATRGHTARRAAVAAALAGTPVRAIGAAVSGPSLNECIALGRQTARELVDTAGSSA